MFESYFISAVMTVHVNVTVHSLKKNYVAFDVFVYIGNWSLSLVFLDATIRTQRGGREVINTSCNTAIWVVAMFSHYVIATPLESQTFSKH